MLRSHITQPSLFILLSLVLKCHNLFIIAHVTLKEKMHLYILSPLRVCKGSRNFNFSFKFNSEITLLSFGKYYYLNARLLVLQWCSDEHC